MRRKSNKQMAEDIVLCKILFMRLHGSDWEKKLEPYIATVRQKMEADAIPELEAAIDLGKRDEYRNDSLGLIAAAVEILRRSEECQFKA